MRKVALLLLVACYAMADDNLYKPLQIGPKNRNQIVRKGFEIGDTVIFDGVTIFDVIKFPSNLKTDSSGTVYGDTSGAIFTCDDVYNCIDTSAVVATQSYVNNGFWNINGNAGTDTATNFIGTTDTKGLFIKTKNITRTLINSDGSRTDFYTGTNGGSLTNSFSGSAYLSSYGTGNFIYSGDLTFAGKGDSALWARWKRISVQTYSGGSIELISNNHLTSSAINNIKTSAGNLIYHKAKNGIYVGNNDTIIAANSYGSSVILGSDDSHIDSGSLNLIVGSYKCAIRGVGSNPFNNMSHSLIFGGYGDTTHCYHEIAIGPGAVENRSPFSSGAWDNRDLYLSMGNYGGSTLAIDSEQSNLIIIKHGNMAIGTALRAVNIPDTTDAMVHIYGSLQIEDSTQANGYVLTSDANGLASWKGLGGSNGSDIPAYANNAAAFAVLGAGKLYYTDVAGEYILKVTH